MKASTLLFSLLVAGLIVFMGCSKDDNPTGSAGGSTTYYGTFANALESGSLTLNFASAPKASPRNSAGIFTIINITGTLKILGDGTFSITGTFNTDNDSLKIKAGPYSFEGTLSNGELTGTYSGPNGEGTFIGGKPESGSVKIFCGTYTEELPTANAHHGKLNIILDGTKLGVLVRDDDDTENNVLGFKGTLNGSEIRIYYSGTSGLPLATGTINEAHTSMAGTYNNVADGESGTWSAVLCQ